MAETLPVRTVTRKGKTAWLFLALWIAWIIVLAWLGRQEWRSRRSPARPGTPLPAETRTP